MSKQWSLRDACWSIFGSHDTIYDRQTTQPCSHRKPTGNSMSGKTDYRI